MSRRGWRILAAGLAACCGCRTRPTVPATALQGKWAPAQTTRIRVQVETLGEVPNSGVQLPVVSPDGRWIAYLRLDGNEPVEPDAVFTGRGLEGMSLHVRALAADAQARQVCPSGAAWPAWSPDGKTLLFVAYGQDGRCELATHEPATGATRRMGTGLERMAMPAVSPSGRRVAVVAPARGTATPRLHVLDLATGKRQSCPLGEPAARQLWPQWTADGRVVYVLHLGGRAWLTQWSPARTADSTSEPPAEATPPQRLCEIHLPGSILGAYQAFAGLGRPVSDDDRRFAYYDAGRDRIVLVNLTDGGRTALPTRTRAGCWLGSGRFVAASNAEMLLIAPAPGGRLQSRPATPAPPAVRLMRGPWLPRGRVGRTDRLIALTRGRHRRAFRLVRITVMAADRPPKGRRPVGPLH